MMCLLHMPLTVIIGCHPVLGSPLSSACIHPFGDPVHSQGFRSRVRIATSALNLFWTPTSHSGQKLGFLARAVFQEVFKIHAECGCLPACPPLWPSTVFCSLGDSSSLLTGLQPLPLPSFWGLFLTRRRGDPLTHRPITSSLLTLKGGTPSRHSVKPTSSPW